MVKSPLIVRGKALNNWFFEGSVPVMLIDSHGTVLVQGPGSALTDWMQPGWVEFKADLVWSGMPASSDGELVIKRDNPSGLPENDASVRIPVRF